MKECKTGRVCRELKGCKVVYQLTRQPLDDGGENEVAIARKLGKGSGLRACDEHAESMSRGYFNCLCRERVFEIIAKHRRQIAKMQD